MILINGQEVHPATTAPIRYSLVSPHLVYERVQASSADVPTFPASAANRRAFGFWDEPQAGNYLPEFLYQHFAGGELIREGYFVLTEGSNATGYKGGVTDKLGLFFGELQDVSLQQIDFGTLAMPGTLTPTLSDGLGAACAFPEIENDFFYGNAAASTRVNEYFSGAYQTSPKVPMFFVSWILKRIAQLTGTTIEGDFFDHIDWNLLLLVNMREVRTGTIEVRNHLPNLTLAQFILELRKVMNLKMTFLPVERRLRLDFWEPSLLAPTTLDWTDKASKSETKLPEPNTRVQLSMAVDGADGLAKDKPAALADWLSPEVPGARNGIARIDMAFSTLTLVAGKASCKQEGQSTLYGQETKPWAPRLLFWHGMVSSNPTALPSRGAFTLSPASLATTSWAQTVALRQRMFYVQKELMLSEVDLARLDFAEKIHIEGVDYLLAQLDVSVPIKSVATALLIGGV